MFLEGTAAALVKVIFIKDRFKMRCLTYILFESFQVAVCLLQEAGPLILAAHNLEELMVVMKEGLPSLAHSRLEDVIRQAGSLNISRSVIIAGESDVFNIHGVCRQLETYEVEFIVLQEEQSLSKSEVERPGPGLSRPVELL